MILSNTQVDWTIITICRKSDTNRAPKFFKTLDNFKASGFMADLNDGPEQNPLSSIEIQKTIMELLPSSMFEIILTHSLNGEYTRHLRHEETANAVLSLWRSKKVSANQLWTFAYEDGNGKYLPKAIVEADLSVELTDEIWQRKYSIITEIYGFDKDSFEARTTPRKEAFWRMKI
ncbi:PIG-L family deacetylase [bacterium]|nr:PIG-L family deacetylase [bacterium]